MSYQEPPPPPSYHVATQPTATQPPHYPNTMQGQPPPSGGVPQGAPGVGYGNTTTLQPGTYVMGNTVAMGMSPLSMARDPTNVVCQFCSKSIITRTELVNGQTVTCCALILCLMGCSCGCCLIPCCISSYKDVDHYCPECNMKLGTCLPNQGIRGSHY